MLSLNLYSKVEIGAMCLNYRPISLLPAFSKVLENVLYVRMYQHLINNNILVDEQFGFRTKSSTMAVTLNLINEIIDAFN
jgi:hypothetical protein